MTPEEQVELWVNGTSVHNTERDECCPDFSCCKPELLAPAEVRKAFQLADEKTRYRFLMQFLGELINTIPDKRVHIAGMEEQ